MRRACGPAALFSLLGALLQANVPGRGSALPGHTSVESDPHERMHRLEGDFRACARFIDTTRPDYSRAVTCLEPLAAGGYAPAQYRMAILHEEGLGTPRDPAKAAEWYRKAAGQGHAQSQVNLGVLYARGEGVPRDDSAAAHWYTLAADQELPRGLSNLGSLYLEGRGVRRDVHRAFALFERAALLGSAVAQNNLALMYANGEGVNADYVEAYAWLEMASSELPSAAELRDRISQEMSPDQLRSARSRCAKLRESLARKQQPE